MSSAYHCLEDAILDEMFPEADLRLRRGHHIGREDGAIYDYISDALDHLEPFYRRFGAELIHKSDGYFYLLPRGARLPRQQLSVGEMLVGQALALLYLDPSTLQLGGIVQRSLVLERLYSIVGAEDLFRLLSPRRRYDERIVSERVRTEVAGALRSLAALGFIEILDEENLRLRPALMRFVEPVRSLSDPASALERLIAHGEVEVEESVEEESGEEEEG